MAFFILLYHHSYMPQYHPAEEDDEKAAQVQYLAIGEEWASGEALSQLGVAVRDRRDGKVILSPTITWVSLNQPAQSVCALCLHVLHHRY